MPRVAISAALHAVLALSFALVWFEPPEEDSTILFVRASRPWSVRGSDIDRQADDHPPIVPKVFQPDWNAVNDAKAVIVNSMPTNLDAAPDVGDTLEAFDALSFRGRSLAVAVGTGGGAAGRRGSAGACFG